MIGTRRIFNYPAAFTTLPNYTAHAGARVEVLRQLSQAEADQGEGMERMYEVRADDGWDRPRLRERIAGGRMNAIVTTALAVMEQEMLYERTALTSPAALRDYLRLALAGREHEVFMCVWFDAMHRVIATEELFRGTLTQTSVYPREVVKTALQHNAAAVVFAHNHPSGSAQPSQADELLTRQLREALSLVDCKVLDHFIIAGTNALSFAERGLL